jgi:hypothetical protein
MASYLLGILTALIAVFQLAKDWNAHSSHWRRISVVILIFALLAVMVYNTRSNAARTIADAKRAEERHADDQTQIKNLQAAVDTANTAQAANTKTFLTTLNGLSQKVANLQTQVKTQDLKTQAGQLQKELTATRKALESTPPASFVLSFARDNLNDPIIKRKTLVADNNVVHIDVQVENLTDSEAGEGFINFMICSACRYAKETQGLDHPRGGPETERNLTFVHFHPHTVLPVTSFDILIPPSASSFEIAMDYRCEHCKQPTVEEIMTDKITADVIRR